MKKRLSVVSKTAAAAHILGLGLLLLISCNNVFVPAREGIAGDGETGTVAISFGNGVEGARTLLPSGVSFQLYKLTITPVSPGGPAQYENISSGTSASISLAAGMWSIHVDAYTDSGGLNKAAEGDSETFTVTAGQTTPLSIPLAAISGVDPGALSVDISGEDGAVISYGWLSIYGGPDFNDPVTFDDGLPPDATSASINSTGLDLDISLPAGQYRIAVSIYNSENQWVGINEVAYIYSNLTTELTETVRAADFMAVTTISGTVQYQEDGQDQSWYSLAVSANPVKPDNLLDQTYISSTGAEPYSLRVPQPDKAVTLYFYINSNTFGWIPAGESLTLTPNQSAATKDISLNYTTATLSGAIGTVTMNGKTPDFVNIYANTDNGSYPGVISGGNWQIIIPGSFTGELVISVMAVYNGIGSSKDVYTWTSGSPTTINLGNVNIVYAILSGSIGTVKVNGNDPDYVSVYARTSDGSWYYGDMVSGNTWAISGFPDDFTGKLIIGVQASIGDYWFEKEVATWTSGSPTTINLGNVNIVYTILSGAIGTVTVNGNTPDNVSVYARASSNGNESATGDRSFRGSVSGNNWQVGILGDFTGTLAIGVEVFYKDASSEKDIATWTSGSSFTGINLGDVFFNVLSGSIGTVTVDGNIPYSVSVYAHTSDYDHYYYSAKQINGAWNILIPGDFTEPLTIEVEVYDNTVNGGGTLARKEITTWTPGSSFTDINLGSVSFITLSGSIGAVTVNGKTPENIDVYAYTDSTDSHWGTASNGAWNILIPDDLTGTLTIGVEAEYEGAWYQKDTTVTWTAGSSPTTGISLGAVSISLGSIGGTVTTNGTSALAQGFLYVFGQSGTTLQDFYTQMPLGQAEITGGAFSGRYVSNGNPASGYVAIVAFNGGEPSYYVTPSAVALNTSMSLNLAAMTRWTDVPQPGDPATPH
jgi:hypothetical protein